MAHGTRGQSKSLTDLASAMSRDELCAEPRLVRPGNSPPKMAVERTAMMRRAGAKGYAPAASEKLKGQRRVNSSDDRVLLRLQCICMKKCLCRLHIERRFRPNRIDAGKTLSWVGAGAGRACGKRVSSGTRCRILERGIVLTYVRLMMHRLFAATSW